MEKRRLSASEEKLLITLVRKDDLEEVDKNLRARSRMTTRGRQGDLLKYLVLTGNEVDLKKVLCLHLFAITVPPRPCRRYEDNHKIKEFTKYSFVLPNYFVHDSEEGELYCNCWYNENKEKIGKLRPCKIHLAVNNSIVQIIETVLEVLNNHNKAELERLISLSHDLSAIHSCLSEKSYVNYISSLHSSGFFNNPSILRSEVCTIIKATQKLTEVAHIRKNMVLSLRVPDLIQSLNNLFLSQICGSNRNLGTEIIKNIATSSKTLFYSQGDILKEIERICGSKFVDRKGNENGKNVKTRPFYYYPSLKRWPFTEKEINIKKEIEKLKKVNVKILRKHNINYNEIGKMKNECHFSVFSDSNILENETKCIATKDSKSITNNINLDKKILSPVKFEPQNTLDICKDVLENSLSNSRLALQDESSVYNILLPKTTETKSLIKDSEPEQSNLGIIYTHSIDTNELKNSLLKVELRTKLQKLIATIENS